MYDRPMDYEPIDAVTCLQDDNCALLSVRRYYAFDTDNQMVSCVAEVVSWWITTTVATEAVS